MSKSIQIGGSDFGELVRKDLLFVDKSLFIKEIINDKSKVTLITRPRRWGKTLNMSMLYYFFSAEVYGQKTAGLFDNLLIAKEAENYIERHQGKYPVIFLSLKDTKKLTFSDALEEVNGLIQDIYRQHRVLQNSVYLLDDEKDYVQKMLTTFVTQTDLEKSLKRLSELLYKHYQQQVYILIDEYDTPLNFARGQEYFDEMTLFIKNFLGATLKDNPYLEKGILTGILRISKDSMLSGLNNLEVYTVLRDTLYAPYFGFIDEELDRLFLDQNLQKDEAQVKAWYNGYKVNGLTLYNPWSIMNCLKNKAELMPYWLNTGNDDLLKELLQQSSGEVKTQFQLLVSGQSVSLSVNPTMRFDQVATDNSMLWNLLIFAGYLKVLQSQILGEGNFYQCELAIPNREVLGLYKDIFLQWLTPSDQMLKFKTFVDLLAEGHAEEFAKAVERYLKMAASVHDYANQPEAFYQGFMLALSVALIDKYYIFSNHESGLGRPDLMIIPKDTHKNQAVILEFKTVTGNQTLEQRAQEALEQIQTHEYASVISQYAYIHTIAQVGMAFDGKQALCVQQRCLS
jgi:hypothetical protein